MEGNNLQWDFIEMCMIVVLELHFNWYLIKLSFGVSLHLIEVVVELGGDLSEVRDRVKAIFKLGWIHVDGI